MSTLALSGCGGSEEELLGSTESAVTEDEGRGAFTCDLPVTPGTDLGAITGLFEIDRMYMTDRPGFIVHRLPVTLTAEGEVVGGIQMLFNTFDDARAFSGWLQDDYAPGGALFVERAIFKSHWCQAWELLGRMERPEARTAHVETRVERFRVEGEDPRRQLRAWFPQVRAEAKARGYSSVWLMYSEPDQTAALVYYDDDHSLLSDDQPFAAGAVFDQSAWVLSTWFPFRPGDRGEPSVWPNSPPFPAPGAGDGVCEPSQGETAETTTDCLATCGNRVADPGETWANCPSDVRDYN